MHKFLIPLVACLLCAAALHAQVPELISVPYPFSPNSVLSDAEAVCNDAGTFTLGQFIGQSNDTALDTIFLCEGDSIFINHNGNFDFSGDPIPATPSGIGYVFYDCPPTVIGDNLQNIVLDPCVLIAPNNLPYFAFGNQPDGDLWFSNTGNLQTLFNAGQPVMLYFAPATIDNFANQAYESAIVGAPPGPCVNVNTSVAFAVVYLNAIEESGVSTNFGNDCLGKFRLSGGYPEWDASARYTVDISLQGNSSIKALIHNSADQIGHNTDVIFSVSQPGIYNVTVEDGKSCGHMFQIAMNGCNSTDNAVISLPEVISPPGSQICVPISVSGFQIIGASFSLSWDPTLLQYNGVQNPNPAIGTFNAANLNPQNTAQGVLGVILYNQDVAGQVINIPNNDTLFELCFTLIGPLGSCSGLLVTNDPTPVNIENQNGTTVAVTADTGQVCIDFLPLDVTVEVIDTLCLGNATASIKVTASGGIEGYEVIIDKLITGPTISGNIATSGGMFVRTGLTSGTYSVCVTDDNGGGTTVFCDTITLVIPTLGASLQNTKRPTCFGDADGIVTAIVSLDGTAVPNPGPNFTFTWSPVNPGGNVPVFNNAPVNTYFVTITDQTTGCISTASGTLDGPPPITTDTEIITPASCPGLQDGGITYVAQGGTPFPGGEYQYNWEFTCNPSVPPTQGPAGQDSLIVLTGLGGGCTYFVTITDANGCTFTDEIDVTNLRNVEVTLTGLFNTNCAGDSTGAICVRVVETPPSGNPNYSFFWQPIGFPQTGGGAGDTSCYTNLPANTYAVLAVNGLGCTATDTFQVSSPEAFVLDTFSLQNPNCTFQNNGAIKVIGFGGSGGPNYTYNWSTMAVGNMIMNLLPGDYSVTATDANGCQDSLNFTLSLPAPPVITVVDSSSVKCGSDGSLSVTSPTGVTFDWETIGGQFVGDSSVITGLMGDTFVVTIMDNQGCTTMDTFTLAPVTPMSFSDTTFVQPSCFGYADGSISIGVMDGNPPYNFIWSDSAGQMTPTLINVKAGNYTVTVTDAQGCTLVGTFTLTQPPGISVSANNITSTSCFGVCDGLVTIVANYATPSGPLPGDFNFTWENNSTDSVPTDLCAGYNTLITIDPNNCFRIDSFFIPGPPEVTFDTLYAVPTTCNGGSDGQVRVEGAGGNGGPYTYQWTGGAVTSIVNGLPFGEYTVTITDNNGCTGVYTTEVTQPGPIIVQQDDQSTKPIKCFGGMDGELGVTVAGGNPGTFTYVWEDQDMMVVGNGTSPTVGNLSAGVYSVTATDSKGCTGVLQNLPLNEPPPVEGIYLPWDELVCNGDETTLYIDTIFGGSGGPYQFSLDFGVTLNQGFPVSMSGGIHYITYIDRNLCEHTDTIEVIEPDPITVTFVPAIVEIELGDTTLQLIPIITGAVVVDTFIWTPSQSLHYPGDLMPLVHTFESETYTLTVFDANGCSGTGSIVVNVDPNRNVYIPNVFYPGSTKGLNDYFNPQVGLGVQEVNYVRIYDRWGGLMYEREHYFPNNDNLAEGWDGRYRGDYVNPGVFIYVIEVLFLDGRVLLYRGDVTVYR